jgi:cobalt/nickel transport protein
VKALTRNSWGRRALLLLLLLVVLAPAFGWASGVVGYAEPLENAAEATGAADEASPLISGPFPDYSVPGLGAPAGTLVSAVVGTTLTLVFALCAGKLVER